MAWINDFLEKLFPVKEKYGGDPASVVIDIPAELYYKELAIYTASSLISNAISRSEIRTFERGVPVKKQDYYLLNVSPNRNETSSLLKSVIFTLHDKKRWGKHLQYKNKVVSLHPKSNYYSNLLNNEKLKSDFGSRNSIRYDFCMHQC